MSETIVIYQSLSGNTKKIAEAIALGAKTKAVRVNELKEGEINGADTVFLGSGIYGGSHHRQINEIVGELNLKTRVFIYSTAGMPVFNFIWHQKLKNLLAKRKIKVIGEMCFKGFDTFGPLKWFRGINKGRPDEKDLEKAREIGRKYTDC